MPTTYEVCPEEVRQAADAVVAKYHPDLAQAGVTVRYMFARASRNKKGEIIAAAVSHGGYPCAAKVKIVGLQDRAGGHEDALVTIDEDEWNGLNGEQRASLLDHELHHLQPKIRRKDKKNITDDLGRPKLVIRKHDHQFGWFDVIAQRHGGASYEVKQAKAFADKAGQFYFGWNENPKQLVTEQPTLPDVPVSDGKPNGKGKKAGKKKDSEPTPIAESLPDVARADAPAATAPSSQASVVVTPGTATVYTPEQLGTFKGPLKSSTYPLMAAWIKSGSTPEIKAAVDLPASGTDWLYVAVVGADGTGAALWLLPLLPVEYQAHGEDISGFGGVEVAMKGQRMKLGPSAMGFMVQA